MRIYAYSCAACIAISGTITSTVLGQEPGMCNRTRLSYLEKGLYMSGGLAGTVNIGLPIDSMTSTAAGVGHLCMVGCCSLYIYF